MKKSDILKQLKKEKDPLKYLADLLRKTSDKKLIKEIEALMEKLTKELLKGKSTREPEKEPGKKPLKSLEQAVQNIPVRPPRVETEILEDYQARPSRRILIPSGIGGEEPKPEESYGGKIKGDYITTKSEFRRSSETKGLISRTGFLTTAESKHALRQEAGERNYDSEEETIKYHHDREDFMREDDTGLTPDQKQAKKGKKEIEQYHGR